MMEICPSPTPMSNVESVNNEVEESPAGSMSVFRYEKTLLSRLHECKDVLKATQNVIPASKVLEQWRYFIEMQIEPAGMI